MKLNKPIRVIPTMLRAILVAGMVAGLNRQALAQNKGEQRASLIPMSQDLAILATQQRLRHLGLEVAGGAQSIATDIKYVNGSYRFRQLQPYLEAVLNSRSGEFSANRYDFGLRDKGIEVGPGKVRKEMTNPQSETVAPWVNLLRKYGTGLDGYHCKYLGDYDKHLVLTFIKDVDLQNDKGYQTVGPLIIEFDKTDKSVYCAYDNRSTCVSWAGKTLSYAQAMSLANYLILGDNPTKLELTDTSHFSEDQRKKWQPVVTKYPAATAKEFYQGAHLELMRDQWLMVKPVWKLNFGNFILLLDAETGEPISSGYKSWAEDLSWIGPQPESGKTFEHAKPSWFNPASSSGPTVVFNGNPLSSEDERPLHFPPVRQDNAALVNAAYFPNFEVNLHRDGYRVILEGKLKGRGKNATLKIGEKEITVDGKDITLSAPAQEINGQLYLPAELLQLCNGIPIRWEPKKNTLWIDTRYLRRDE